MNIRTAILRAADSIEQNPHLFSFESIDNPSHSCGTPGCALGWIAHHAEISAWANDDGTTSLHKMTGLSQSDDGDEEFYVRMRALCGSESWKGCPDICASTLRLYADEYHPEEKGSWEAIKDIWNPLEKV